MMKARQIEIKKEREKETRRSRASELHYQITISRGGRFGCGVSSSSSTISGREYDYMMFSSTSNYSSGENRENRVHRGTNNESSFGEWGQGDGCRISEEENHSRSRYQETPPPVGAGI